MPGKDERSKKRVKRTLNEKQKSSSNQLNIRLVRSLIGRPRKHREVLRGLGLRKLNSQVIRNDCPEIRGMVNKVHHLINVEAVKKK